jgi:phage/plasmid-like protein (TIGR03299 family)
MAHELDLNEANGRRSMFSVLETPWHREGVILNQAPSFLEAMTLAGCNFTVECRPLYVTEHQPGTGVEYLQSPTGQAVRRTDRQGRESVLAVVGDTYEPVQYVDAFGILEPLLDQGVATLETGGTLRGGRDAWMLVKFNVKDPVVLEVFAREVVPFGLITSNHSGDASVQMMETPIRVVCANTLGAALGRGGMVKVSHRGENAKVRVVEAAQQMFGGLVDRYRAIAEQYANLKARILTVQEFTSCVLDKSAPLPPDLHTPAGAHLTIRGYDLARAAADARRTAITAAWTSGKGHTGDLSAWEAYNGLVQVVDHDAELFRTRGSRVASMISGRLLATKKVALDSLVTLSRN